MAKLYLGTSGYTYKDWRSTFYPQWSQKIIPHLNQGDVYVFFNNTYAGQALTNANELRELLTK